MAALPGNYAEALRLAGLGLPVGEIASQLDVPVPSVDALLRLAEAKLASLLNQIPKAGEMNSGSGT